MNYRVLLPQPITDPGKQFLLDALGGHQQESETP